jgi:hypothetical protein
MPKLSINDAPPSPAEAVTDTKSDDPAAPGSISVRCIVCEGEWHPQCRYCWRRLAAFTFAPRRR